MPKSSNQKLKTLYILDILKAKTDENHGITMQKLLSELESRGVVAERKSVYDDIAVLRDVYGADIHSTRAGAGSEYALVSREFELPELKLLVDAVQSSRFITHKKSMELIKKLETLTGDEGARSLRGQVYVANRIKAMNETIYYNVDAINDAITHNRKITFKYFEWTPEKKKRLRRDGMLYNVSPHALCWDDENYYLVAFDSLSGKMRHYRVDKMLDIAVTDEKREGELGNFDTALYSKRIFGMYGGREERVTVRFENSLAGAVIDRFGADVMMIPHGEYFNVTVDVSVSPTFFSWLTSFGARAEILSPETVVKEFKDRLKCILDKYKD